MSRCCVDKCSDTADGKVFFTFPASKTLRRKWLDVAPVKEKITMDSVICNHHFLDHEYEWVRGKTRLKAKVVPSVFNTSPPKSPPKEPQQHIHDVHNDVPLAIDNNIPQSTKKKKSETNINKEIEQNGGIVKRQEPNLSLDEANKDIEEIITNYQIKQIRPINRNIETEKQNGERCNGVREDIGDVVTIEEDADPVYIEVSVDKGGQGGDCLMVLESLQCDVDPGLFEPPQDYSDRKEEPISLLTSSDDDDVIIQEPRIDIVEVSDETDEDDRPLRKLAAAEPAGRARRKKGGRKRGKSKVTLDAESPVYFPLYDLTPFHFSSAECRGERLSQRPPRASPVVLRLCVRCAPAAASDAPLARPRRPQRPQRRRTRTHRPQRRRTRTHRPQRRRTRTHRPQRRRTRTHRTQRRRTRMHRARSDAGRARTARSDAGRARTARSDAGRSRTARSDAGRARTARSDAGRACTVHAATQDAHAPPAATQDAHAPCTQRRRTRTHRPQRRRTRMHRARSDACAPRPCPSWRRRRLSPTELPAVAGGAGAVADRAVARRRRRRQLSLLELLTGAE